MQVEKDRSGHFGDCMHGLLVQGPQWQPLATHRREEKKTSGQIIKTHKLMPWSTINPSPRVYQLEKSLGIKPWPAARVLYCLSFFSADKRSGIYCIHKIMAVTIFVTCGEIKPVQDKTQQINEKNTSLNH